MPVKAALTIWRNRHEFGGVCLGVKPARLCLGTIGVYEQRETPGAPSMPRLPSTSAAFVLKRKAITKAEKAERANEPAAVPVVKVRIAKPR
jgi:hypothetical protein